VHLRVALALPVNKVLYSDVSMNALFEQQFAGDRQCHTPPTRGLQGYGEL